MGTSGNLWELMGIIMRVSALQGVFTYRFFHTNAFFTLCVFSLQVVYRLRVFAARRFFVAYFTLRVFFTQCFGDYREFSRCIFHTTGRFFVAYFTLQDVFSLGISHCRAFFRCVFYTAGRFSLCILCCVTVYCRVLLHFLSQCMHFIRQSTLFLRHNIRMFIKPQRVFHSVSIQLIEYYYT